MNPSLEPWDRSPKSINIFNSNRKRCFTTLYFFCFITIQVLSSVTTVNSQGYKEGVLSTISVNSNGDSGNGSSYKPKISADGRFIAFLSTATNLSTETQTTTQDLFLHDQINRTTTLLEKNVDSFNISSDGRFFSFKLISDSNSNYLLDILTKQKIIINKHPLNQTVFPITGILDLSTDGHYGVLAGINELFNNRTANPETNNVFIYDRYQDQFLSLPTNHLEINTDSEFPGSVISGDGRFILFQASITSQDNSSSNRTIFLYNRVLGEYESIDLGELEIGSAERIASMDISENGRFIAIEYSNLNNSSDNVMVIDRSHQTAVVILNLQGISKGIALSSNGKYLAVSKTVPSGHNTLFRYGLNDGKVIKIDEGIIGEDLNISSDGSKIVYTKITNNIFQIMLWDDAPDSLLNFVVAGRITGETGTPLALVSIVSGKGEKSNTDQAGYFWITGVSPGERTFTPNKNGFEFKPKYSSIDVEDDIHNLSINYTHKKLIEEAKKDLGMPYNWIRGNDGQFHGHQAGYCTDLVLDAFTWGLEFKIQFALEMDFKAHPWHYYRWRDARNAHDMWRYFSYSGQFHSHHDPYQPGDIVFFDWTLDGVIDHVALISEVDHHDRPKMLLDATGKIDSNPSGLAAELEWEPFHEKTVRGFARWSGLFEPIISASLNGQILQLALVGEDIDVIMENESGAIISSQQTEILGAIYHDFYYEKMISIVDDQTIVTHYLLILINPSDQEQPYKLFAQYLVNDKISDRIELSGILKNNQIISIPLRISRDNAGEWNLDTAIYARRVEGSIP